MGGYGALRCALKYPDTFGNCASFSGALDPLGAIELRTEEQIKLAGDYKKDIQAVIGPDLTATSGFSVEDLLEKVKTRGKLPRIFMTCGFEDFLYSQSKEFAEKARQLSNIDLVYLEWEGDHEWSFWDKSVDLMLKHFLRKGG